MPANSTLDRWPDGSPRFATTHWTMVLEAGAEGPARDSAMDQFCAAYWYPVYAFIRRRGNDAETSRDLTQGFFEKLLAENWLGRVDRRETRFSTLLLTVLTHFLISRHEKDTAQKRGGGRETFSLDLARAEHWFGAEPVDQVTPERLFERRWAMAVLDAALERLRRECEMSGRGRSFAVLGPYLSRDPESGDYDAAADKLGIARGSVAVAVHRLRQEYRACLREEVAAGLRDPARVDEELRALSDALRG